MARGKITDAVERDGIDPDQSPLRGALVVKAPVLADIVGLTIQRLGQLAAEGMPKAGRDGYPLAAAVQWIVGYWRKRAVQTPLSDARRRKIEADAESAELGLARRRGDLVPVSVLAQVHGEACARLRTRMLTIPTKSSPKLRRCKTLRDHEKVLRADIMEALEELIVDISDAGSDAGGGTTEMLARVSPGRAAELKATDSAVAQ